LQRLKRCWRGGWIGTSAEMSRKKPRDGIRIVQWLDGSEETGI
jgi:hypothetical protein